MAVRLIHRLRDRRNLRLLPQNRVAPENAEPVGAHEHREAAMAICLIHRLRDRRNLRLLIQNRVAPVRTPNL